MRLILVRHGQSQLQVGVQGDDLGLTDMGRQQAELLGQWLKVNEPVINMLICSPLRRACETASILKRYVGTPVNMDDDLREADRDLFMELPRLVHPMDVGPQYYVLPHDNYYQRYAEQTRRTLNRLIDNPSAVRTVLIVCHGGTASTMVRMLLRCHHLHIWMHNTAMHYLTWQEGLWDVRGINYTPHLTGDRLT